MNDEKVMSAIRARNEAAIHDVITRYSKLLWSVSSAVLHRTGSAQDVEECVADTFIYLWEHPDKYDPQRGRLKTWLAIVARTQAANRCRELARRSTVPLDETALIDSLGLAEAVLREEARQTLLTAVDALGEPDRDILLRRSYRGPKPREIALALNMSVKQVDNRLYQTKQRLRQALSD